MKETAFGESDHMADTPMEEQFDRMSKENYDGIDAELVESLNEAARKSKDVPVFRGLVNVVLLYAMIYLAYHIVVFLVKVVFGD